MTKVGLGMAGSSGMEGDHEGNAGFLLPLFWKPMMFFLAYSHVPSQRTNFKVMFGCVPFIIHATMR